MKIFKKKWFYIIVLILIAITIGYFLFFKNKSKTNYELDTVKRGNLIQKVSVTGTVKPSTNVDLAFERGGKVASVNVSVGNRVKSGQVLVTLVNDDLQAQLNQAEAKLEELKKGSRPEEIDIQKEKVKTAKDSLLDAIDDAYTKSDDAIRNKTDKLFSNPSTFPQINIPIKDIVLKSQIESERLFLEPVLNNWKDNLTDYNLAKDNLNKIKDFLDKLATAVNALTESATLSQTTIDGYKTEISTCRTNINTAIMNLNSAINNLNLQEKQLELYEAGTILEQIKAQEAGVEEIKANISKTIMVSPINGIITKNEAKVGEIVPANTPIISIISDSKLQIEAYVPEADIAKVKINDLAEVTLDAYGKDVLFEAKVVSIDPAETIIEGVSTYKTVLEFTKEDAKIKSGMTANTDIITARKENVLYIPQRAVITKDKEKIVRKIDNNNQITEVKVETGLKDSDGNIEVLSGLSEGEKIVVYTK